MGSQKRFVVISVVGIIAIVAGLSYLTYRFVSGSGWSQGLRGIANEKSLSSESADRSPSPLLTINTGAVDLTGVERVVIRGGWSIVIRADNEPSLLVEASERHADRVTVRRTEDAVELSISDNTNYSGARFRAELVLPDLSVISVEGLANLMLEDLELESLRVQVAGAANVEATDSSFKNLVLAIEGAANVDFSSSPSTNVTVNIAGLANADILMDGGVLDGSLEGLARVTYRGAVSEQLLSTESGGFLRAVGVQQAE